MAGSKQPSPKLAKSTALSKAQATVARLGALVPSLTTTLSPVTVYQPDVTVGGELATSTGGLGVPGSNVIANFYGVWVAPDLTGTGAEYYVQVECFGGGGGGGGGASAGGGGGGGGGEYACEPQYPIIPGNEYAYVVGLPGSSGVNNTSPTANPGAAGGAGGVTIFDIQGLGLANGVVANGGVGGDTTSVGIGGAGGSGSANTIHANGGAGGTNSSGSGSDNPLAIAITAGDFAGDPLNTSVISAWLILNDAATNGAKLNDASGNSRVGLITNYSGGFVKEAVTAPAQAPAYTEPVNFYGPNPTQAAVAGRWKLGSLTSASSKVITGAPMAGTKLTVSAWIQCDPAGTWGNTAAGSFAVIAANTQNYNGNTMKGYALFMFNAGTASSPNWQIKAAVGNGTSRTIVSDTLGAASPGTWYQVVLTYNAGTLSLYVNGSLIQSATSSGYTSVPGGSFNATLGLDPGSTANWFFGYMSNVWFAQAALTAQGVSQAFGVVAPTGGAGGGSSGGPGGAGATGASSTGGAGGAGGLPVATPASLSSSTTPAMGGYAGAAAGFTNAFPSAPSGGVYGGGGGGDGDMFTNPSLVQVTVPFASALTYYGADATSGAGNPYNTAQQSNPNSALNTVLYAGGAAADSATGSKISVLLLPQGLAAELGKSAWRISQVLLTFTNAYPSNAQESLLEVYYTNDTSLPQTYLANYSGNNVAAIPIPSGAGTITYDITESGIGGNQSTPGGLQLGTVTALLLGPNSTPTIDAYNSPTGPDFYSAIYGPGAADLAGNSQAPYLTIYLVPTTTVQVGSEGAGGGIVITAPNPEGTPTGMINPYATTDAAGNQFAAGYTGRVSAFNPALSTPGSFAPETWHNVAASSGFTVDTVQRYKLFPDNTVHIQFNLASTNTAGTYTLFTLPTGYIPANEYDGPAPGLFNTTGTFSAALLNTRFRVTTGGAVQIVSLPGTAINNVSGYYIVPLD